VLPSFGFACPVGWHLPSKYEWTILVDFLGGEDLAGDKMKEAGTAHWWRPNKGASNVSGLSMLPGGFRNFNNTAHHGIGGNGFWWSDTEVNVYDVYILGLFSGTTSVIGLDDDKKNGFSIRCIKN